MSTSKEEQTHFCSLELDGVENKIIIIDLQSVFQKSMGENVTLVHYRTSSLVPLKENYGSRVSKTIACIKSEDSTVQKLSLMAKFNFASKFQEQFIDDTVAFVKEILIYETLLPAYEKLYCNENKFKISPKYYGGRLSSCQYSNIADDDALLLTENLQNHGYYTAQKYYGLDFDHAKMAITTLARFHALGMAVKMKNPKVFEALEFMCRETFYLQDNNTNEIIKHVVDTVCKPTLTEYIKKMTLNMKKNNWSAWLRPSEEVEPWVTIIHGDFCIDNILYHNTLEGDVDDAKLINFQLAKIGSPQLDLIFFLCSSLDYEAMENHFDELLDFYYDKLIETLHATDAYKPALSRESFNQRLQEVARTELFHCLMGIKFATDGNKFDFDYDLYSTDSELLEATDGLFETRARLATLKFIEKDWL